MILNKFADKNNIKIMSEKYLEWLSSGITSDKILVIVSNSNSKKNIVNEILANQQSGVLSELKIFSFKGVIYNSVLDNWGILENKIGDTNAVTIPNMSGLEISQFILKDIIKEEEVKGYNSKKSLLHQIFRRYSLITNNNLSQKELEKKSAVLGESFGKDAERIIKKLRPKTLELRAFDNIRQSQIFSYIYKNTDYFKNIEYLILEDGDEITPLCLDFLEHISSHIKDKLIITDKDGGTRCGYLCAAPNAKSELERIFNEKLTDDIKETDDIISLKNNILNNEKNVLKNINIYPHSKRVDMAEHAVDMINLLVKNGVEPNEISVVTPIQDKMLRVTLLSRLKNSTPLFLSGSEKLADYPLIKSILTVLKLSKNNEKISDKYTQYLNSANEYELRIILSKYLGIPIKKCRQILENYKRENKLVPVDLGYYTNVFRSFCELISELKKSERTLSEKAYFTYINLFKKVDKNDLEKFNFFLKELQNFERIFRLEQREFLEEEIINQMENSIISENPYSILDVCESDIVVGTPQKIIDNKIKTKYQFWLDTSSVEWVKSDIGPLYNSWVFQKSWDKDEYTIEDNIRLSKEKTYKILRKLILNSEKIIALSSLFDTQGIENFGGIEGYLITQHKSESEETEKCFKIIPREDQKPVLEYKSGQMAISAVPGAGKTTILLALIMELIERGVEAENIYVLTYMESAARNFKDRISLNINKGKLPNISTIHGLALRIIKENGNYERIDLDPDFEICDDTQKGNIIKSVSTGLDKKEMEDFERSVSTLKLSGAEINPNNNKKIRKILSLKAGTKEEMKLLRFLKFFYNYQKRLESENLIDYDDILISAVKLLENNQDILEYYQDLCEYIIEDEAQDSSFIQQKLINLLSAKHKNLIRCGDINQAITTTFTNADVDGFKSFIENSQKVNMDQSQRCSRGVWELANKLLKYGNLKQNEPFYEIYMKPVDGKNPEESYPIKTHIFDSPKEEKIRIVKEIKNILSQNPKATIGILLRGNYQVNDWANYLNNSGLSAITRNECLGQKKIFKVIFSILKFIDNPFNNYYLADAYKTLAECGFFKLNMDKIILSYENEHIDFINLDNDEIKDSDLARFHWDMNYWLSFPELTIDELAMRIGLHYFNETIEKSNIHLIATLCAKLDKGIFSQTVQKLQDLSQRQNLSGFKFFSEDEEPDMTAGKVQVMTLHKSKGDEFDYVFLPEMSEKNLTLDITQLKLKQLSDFMESVKSLNPEYKVKSEHELKEFLINENYRLLYVAITRAKRRLYLTSSLTEISFGKQKESVPSIIFEELL